MDTIQTHVWTYSRNVSAISLASTSVASSISPSDCTATTSSTVPGLGEVSGRAILALGKVTLRGAEHIITRRRLDVISAKFPHRNADHISGIDQMYKDILELSRRDLYHNAIRIRALRVILAQIGSHQTQKLIEHLLGWPFIEIKIFISELTALLNPLQLHSAQKLEKISAPVQAYTQSLATWESHSLEPFLVFLQRLATRSDIASQAILEGGILDYLLYLYASNFSDPLAQKDAGDFSRTSILYAGCNSLLRILSTAHGGLVLISRHPFHVLWSIRPELPFTNLVSDRIIRRAQIWKSMDRELINWRIRAIMEMVLDWRRPYEQEFLMDITVDILEFSGSETSEPDIYSRALRLFYRLVSIDRISARHAICHYWTLGTHEYFVKLMSRIIVRISCLITSDTPEWEIFVLPWNEPQFRPLDEVFFKSNAVLRIIDWFIETARINEGFLTVILEANILGLLRPFLQQEFRDTPYLTQHSGDKLMVYDIADFEFLVMIREHGLRKLYSLVSNQDPDFVDPRRVILSRAFDVVLRRKQETNEAEARWLLRAVNPNED